MEDVFCTNCAKKEGDTIVEKGHLMVKLVGVLKNGGEAFACPKCDHPRLIEIATQNFPPAD